MRQNIETLDDALAYIERLEDALLNFVPFSMADDVNILGVFDNANPAAISAFRRDTSYLDQSMFLLAAELTEHRRR